MGDPGGEVRSFIARDPHTDLRASDTSTFGPPYGPTGTLVFFEGRIWAGALASGSPTPRPFAIVGIQ